MVTAILVLGAASLFASGIIFRHKRFLTYIATAGILFEAAWLFLTLLTRTLPLPISTSAVYTGGSVILLLVSLIFFKRWTSPYATSGGGVRDLLILPVLGLVIASTTLIASHNGFKDHAWVTHGFYNGDTATFVSLTQRSLATSALVAENPFAGNEYLEYPTLLHAAVGSFLQEIGMGGGVLHFLPALTFTQIFFTIPLLYLLWDVLFPEPKNAADTWFGLRRRSAVYILQTSIIAYILALSWDTYVYPQSHFFLTGLLLLLPALLAHAYTLRGKSEVVYVLLAAAIAAVLLMSNAVMGTVAMALVTVFSLLHVSSIKRTPSERGAYLLAALGSAAAFMIAASGDPEFGRPSFSYTAAFDMVRLSLPVLVLLIGVWHHITRHTFIASASALLASLAFFTFFTSTRDIVVENASRFFYHSLLVGFPLIITPAIQGYFILRRELLYSTRMMGERLALWLTAAVAVLLIMLPAGASVVSAHDNLLYKDEQTITSAMRNALWWIEDNTASDAIFLASPQAPFAIPMFTGRSLLRTDYWLSPHDELQSDIVAAFTGDSAAQQRVLPHADYLLLTRQEREAWEPLPEQFSRVLDIGGIVIYRLR